MQDSPFIEDAAWQILQSPSTSEKRALTGKVAEAWGQGHYASGSENAIEHLAQPGRPVKPQLVAPGKLPKRSLNSEAGRAALIHAVAHIELNAIDLAWDAVYRFRDWPDDTNRQAFISDWIGVAVDEARHFAMLEERLGQLDHCYGDFDAHNGLWDAAVRTMDDALARMALVPRVLEARGLDVTPAMINKFTGAGDAQTVSILEVILQEEVAHVAAGTRWFHFLCAQRGLEPRETFKRLVAERFTGKIRGPFNQAARRAAGFSDQEMADLEAG